MNKVNESVSHKIDRSHNPLVGIMERSLLSMSVFISLMSFLL